MVRIQLAVPLAHSALTAERIRQFAATHERALAHVEKVAPRSSETAPVKYLLDARLTRIIEEIDGEATTDAKAEARAKHAWIAGYFVLASEVGSAHIDALSRLYPHWQRVAVRARVGAAATGYVTRGRSRRQMAPYATAEGTELLAAGITALHRAVSAAQRSARAKA